MNRIVYYLSKYWLLFRIKMHFYKDNSKKNMYVAYALYTKQGRELLAKAMLNQ